MQESFYYFWLMTYSHWNQRQVHDSYKKISLYRHSKLRLLSSRSHSSLHTYYYLSGTIRALGWLPWWAVNNSFFFLSAHSHLPFPIFFHLFLNFTSSLTTHVLPFISSSSSHVLFPFHSFVLVILFCATSTLPTYMPPTERKKCIHISWLPLRTPYNIIISFSLWSSHASSVLPTPSTASHSITSSIPPLMRFAVC